MQAVADEIGQVLNFRILVVVRQDHRIQLLAQALDPVEQRLSLGKVVGHGLILTRRADEFAKSRHDRLSAVVGLRETVVAAAGG